MDLDDKGDLLFRTYYMVDWKSTQQVHTETRCVTCGGEMKKAEPSRDRRGTLYDGFVCHSCKSIFWLKQG